MVIMAIVLLQKESGDLTFTLRICGGKKVRDKLKAGLRI
jgi:hypothetical protein